MKKFFQGLLTTIGLVLAYLLFWPVDVDPVAWEAPDPPEMKGKFAPNDYLQDAEILGVNDGIGPEDIAVDEAGNMYAGYEDGRIIKYDVFGKIWEYLSIRVGGLSVLSLTLHGIWLLPMQIRGYCKQI